MGAFDELIEKIIQHTDLEKKAHSIALTLQEATAKRHYYTPSEDLLMVRDDSPNFSLMDSFDFIDYTRTSIVVRARSSITASMEGPHLWFLTEKAIRLHRDLAYDGYYDNQKES